MSNRKENRATVGDIRKVIAGLPDTAPVMILDTLWGKDARGRCFPVGRPFRALAVQGTSGHWSWFLMGQSVYPETPPVEILILGDDRDNETDGFPFR